MLEDISASVFEAIDANGFIEVALLMRRTGKILGAWTKGEISPEIVSVMAATMLGSIETISEALGRPSPERAVVETEGCRMLAEKFEPHGVIVLMATKDLSADALQRASLRIRDRVSSTSVGAQGTRHTMSAQIQPTQQLHGR